MKVALCHDWLTGMRGGEKCLEDIAMLFPDSEIYTLLSVPRALSPALRLKVVHTSFLQHLPFAARSYKYCLPLFTRAAGSMRIRNADLVISVSHCVANGISAPAGTPRISYCLTPMRYAWLFFDEYFGAYPAWARARLERLLEGLRRWDVRESAKVDHFIAISHHVRKRIREFYSRDARVIYPPADTGFFTPAETRRGDFYLVVSALVPYKRVDIAVQAANELGQKLVVVGDGPERKRLERLAGPTVTFTGRLPDAGLRAYYRSARALIFPGEEDFGIVPVEAQGCGLPVIAYARGGALETVIGGRTGVFFHRADAESLKKAVVECRGVRWEESVIRQNAERFSRARFREEFRDAVAAVVGEKASSPA